MENIIVYSNQCISCFHKRRLFELKVFCRKNLLTLEERRVTYNKAWQDEANSFGTQLPIVTLGDRHVSLFGNFEELL